MVDSEENSDNLSEWMNLIDRGGLWHVKKEMFVLFKRCSDPTLKFRLLEIFQHK